MPTVCKKLGSILAGVRGRGPRSGRNITRRITQQPWPWRVCNLMGEVANQVITAYYGRWYRNGLTKVLLNVDECTVGLPYPWVPYLWIQPTSIESIWKKISRSSKKQNLNLPQAGNCLHSIYIVFTKRLHCIRYYKYSRDDLKYTGGYV